MYNCVEQTQDIQFCVPQNTSTKKTPYALLKKLNYEDNANISLCQ
jgi:hypothetical protein